MDVNILKTLGLRINIIFNQLPRLPILPKPDAFKIIFRFWPFCASSLCNIFIKLSQ